MPLAEKITADARLCMKDFSNEETRGLMRHVMLVIEQFRPCTYSSLVGPRTTSDGPLVISFVFRLAFVKIKTSVQAAFCSNWISSLGNCCLDNQPDHSKSMQEPDASIVQQRYCAGPQAILESDLNSFLKKIFNSNQPTVFWGGGSEKIHPEVVRL